MDSRWRFFGLSGTGHFFGSSAESNRAKERSHDGIAESNGVGGLNRGVRRANGRPVNRMAAGVWLCDSFHGLRRSRAQPLASTTRQFGAKKGSMLVRVECSE